MPKISLYQYYQYSLHIVLASVRKQGYLGIVRFNYQSVFIGVPEALVGARGQDPKSKEGPSHILPPAGDPAMPLHVPDRPGFPRGRVGGQ